MAENLLNIKTIRDIYENFLSHYDHFKPDKYLLDKGYLLSEIILRLGKGPELEEMVAACDRGYELYPPRL